MTRRSSFRTDLADTERVAGVTAEAIDESAAIHRDDVAIAKRLVVRNAMHHHIVDGSANGGREWTTIRIRKTLESGFRTMVTDKLFSQGVQLAGRDTRLNNFCDFSERCADQQVGLAQQLYLIVCFQINHSD